MLICEVIKMSLFAMLMGQAIMKKTTSQSLVGCAAGKSDLAFIQGGKI